MCLISMIVPLTAPAEEPERSPTTVATELFQFYGQKLDSLTYIPAMAVYGRWLFGKLSGNAAFQEEVLKLTKRDWPAPKQPVDYAGCLIYAAIAHADGPQREHALGIVRRAADQLFEGKHPDTVRPPSPQEMSDAVFMIAPILAEAGALTGEARYFDGAVSYLKEMRQLRLRKDGLYRHGHLCDAAWGRGNGFPAIGVTWCLTCLPKDHPGRDEVLKEYQHHLAALIPYQTKEGFWRQVIDIPEAYQEFSATAMIGFAIQRGVREGGLDAKTYQPAADRAWRALCTHLEPGGKVIDVCEGTGTQKSLEDYLHRKAIRGRDDRAGAMALLFATERLADKAK